MPPDTQPKIQPIELDLLALAETAAHVANEARHAGDIDGAASARTLARVLRLMHGRIERTS